MIWTILQIAGILSVSSAAGILRTIGLNDGTKMPPLSFGTFGIKDLIDTAIKPVKEVKEVIEEGYKEIDTASRYIQNLLSTSNHLNSQIPLQISSATGIQLTVQLNDGRNMPALSFGTFGRKDLIDTAIKPAVIKAIEAGYRQIDTASIYQNEEQVGEAIADVISRGVVTREELWITSKLHPSIGTREGVLPGIKDSLKKLNLDYVDLYLIHVPYNVFNVSDHDILNIWKGMEDAKKANLARSIGVSNFNSSHINRLLANSDTVPAVNEIEVHPVYASLEIVSYCQSQNIAVLAYAPFGFMVPRPFLANPPQSKFEEPLLKQLAEKYGKNPSQIVLRYLVDRGMVPIPRSTDATHIEENKDLFDFNLTENEVLAVNELNQGVKVYEFDPQPLATMLGYYELL